MSGNRSSLQNADALAHLALFLLDEQVASGVILLLSPDENRKEEDGEPEQD